MRALGVTRQLEAPGSTSGYCVASTGASCTYPNALLESRIPVSCYRAHYRRSLV